MLKVFFILGVCFFFYMGLGSYALLNNNEGLYAQIAWEMMDKGNWIIPHLNGVPYIEKPPLLYWLVAGSFKLFGKTEFAARLVPATFGVLTCLALYLFGYSCGKKKQGQYAALILASSCGFIVFSRMLFFDGALSFFLTCSALSFYKFYQTRTQKYLYILSILMAGAVMTKGLVAVVLMGGIILSFLSLERQLTFLKFLFNPWSISLFFLLTIPWHWAAALQEPSFSWFYFINEHWMRFLDKRIPKDYYTGPLYYYIPRVVAYMVPWTFLAPFFVRRNSGLFDTSFKRFVSCWFLVPFIFFSVSKAKANYYMVVGIPPLALWLGGYLSEWSRRRLFLAIGMVFSVLAMGGAVFYLQTHEDQMSVKNTVPLLNKENPIYLYKRFEELSTLPFYAGKEIPIIESESRDLWYGQHVSKKEYLFLSLNSYLKKPASIYVMKRDQASFLKKHADIPKEILYDSNIYSIFYLEHTAGEA